MTFYPPFWSDGAPAEHADNHKADGSDPLLAAPGPIGETTADTVRSKLKVLTKATSGSLTAQECTGTQINNLGQSGNVVINLPTCAEGLSFEVLLSTTAAFYYRLDPAATDKIYLDGVALADGYYVGVASAAIGNRIHFEAGVSGTGTYDWFAATGSGNWQAQA